MIWQLSNTGYNKFEFKMLRKVKLLRKTKRMLKVIIISLMQNSLRVDASSFLENNPLLKPSLNFREKRASFGAPWMIPESALKGITRFWEYLSIFMVKIFWNFETQKSSESLPNRNCYLWPRPLSIRNRYVHFFTLKLFPTMSSAKDRPWATEIPLRNAMNSYSSIFCGSFCILASYNYTCI